MGPATAPATQALLFEGLPVGVGETVRLGVEVVAGMVELEVVEPNTVPSVLAVDVLTCAESNHRNIFIIFESLTCLGSLLYCQT